MSFEPLIELVHSGDTRNWTERNRVAFEALFGATGGRYPRPAMERVTLRAPESNEVPFAAYIHPTNPPSGRYSGTSFVIFPIEGNPALFGLVVGTNGLSPDQAILGRPGHARKARAIADWLNRKHGLTAWAKTEPTRTDVTVPDQILGAWQEHSDSLSRYQDVIYAMFRPDTNREATRDALTAFLDLYFEERGVLPVKRERQDSDSIRQAWFDFLMPAVEIDQVARLLVDRKYVIVQGPPGTGKTKMALDLIESVYKGNGMSIQFHANTTYESFVGGLVPTAAEGQVGLQFRPTPGFLMQAAEQARQNPNVNFLLHIDEINRADLGKVLGEAIFLLEVEAGRSREIDLPYDFGPPFGRRLRLPPNLHILGTMNSSDRSIAIVDVAVRRRFAFVSLWPRMSVVEQFGSKTMQDAFRRLTSLFVEHASPESLALVPGHSYFLEADESKARESLQTNLAPLLEEYLAQGYVSGFAESMRTYLQWLSAL